MELGLEMEFCLESGREAMVHQERQPARPGCNPDMPNLGMPNLGMPNPVIPENTAHAIIR
jgi:hypothetical protein